MPHISCPEAYMEELGRALGERVEEHLKASSPIHLHNNSTGHPFNPECFNIIHRETQSASRTIKEAIFICVSDPTLNRNLGKYQLPPVWDSNLQDTLALQLKPSSLTLIPPSSNPY